MIITKLVFGIVIASIMYTFYNVKISDFPENKEYYCCLVAKLCSTSVTPWTVAHQAHLSMGFLRQEYWKVGCHFLLKQIFLTQGMDPSLLNWQAGSLPLTHHGSPRSILFPKFRVGIKQALLLISFKRNCNHL